MQPCLQDVTKPDQALMLPNGTNESDAEVHTVAHLCTEFPPGLYYEEQSA